MGKPRVLIIDDDQGVTLVLQVMLEDKGYEVVAARDGREGYLAYLLFEPHVVITDIQMPLRSGIELMRLIRDHNPLVKTIYMSGDPGKYRSALEEEKTLYHASFLTKPFSRNDLIRLIASL